MHYVQFIEIKIFLFDLTNNRKAGWFSPNYIDRVTDDSVALSPSVQNA